MRLISMTLKKASHHLCIGGGEATAIAIERCNLMTRKLISSGSEFERKIGYSRAVVEGEWVFVSGTTGFDYAAGSNFR